MKYKIVWVNEENETQGCGSFILDKSIAREYADKLNLEFPEITHTIQGDVDSKDVLND